MTSHTTYPRLYNDPLKEDLACPGLQRREHVTHDSAPSRHQPVPKIDAGMTSPTAYPRLYNDPPKEALARSGLQRRPRVPDSARSRRQVNSLGTSDRVREGLAPQSQKRWGGSDYLACVTGTGTHSLSKSEFEDKPCDRARQKTEPGAVSCRHRTYQEPPQEVPSQPIASDSHSIRDNNCTAPRQQHQGLATYICPDRLASLPKDLRNQMPMLTPKAHVRAGEEGIPPSTPRDKVVHLVKTWVTGGTKNLSSVPSIPTPRSAAPRFATSRLAAHYFRDFPIDTSISETNVRYSRNDRASSGSRFTGC